MICNCKAVSFLVDDAQRLEPFEAERKPVTFQFQKTAEPELDHLDDIGWQLNGSFEVVTVWGDARLKAGIAPDPVCVDERDSSGFFGSTWKSEVLNIGVDGIIEPEGWLGLIVDEVEEVGIVIVPVIELFGAAHQEDIVFISRLRLEGTVHNISILANVMLGENLSDFAGELSNVSIYWEKNDNILLQRSLHLLLQEGDEPLQHGWLIFLHDGLQGMLWPDL